MKASAAKHRNVGRQVTAPEVVVAFPPKRDGEGDTKTAPSLAQPSVPLEPETIPLEHDATMIRNSHRAGARASTYSRIEAAVRAMWDEPVCRGCLLLTVASLWLSLFLIDPSPLALLLLALLGLWSRRDKRAAIATVEADSDDWL
jgi:MYXO-CTERM domain-containing protein